MIPSLRSAALTAALFFLCTAAAAAQVKATALRENLDEFFRNDFFDRSGCAMYAADLTTGDPLFTRDEQLLLTPASNMKLLTTAAGLLYLGEEYQFATGLYYTGEFSGGVISGDLFIKGGFDPDFTSEDLDSLIGLMKLYGVREIKGGLYADVTALDSLYWGSGWMWDDDPSTDAPYMSALNINDNAVTVMVIPGEPGSPAIVETSPASSFFEITNNTRTIEDGRFRGDITRDYVNNSNRIIVQGTVPADADTVWERINVMYPEHYFLTLMRERLLLSGIRFFGPAGLMTLPLEAHFLCASRRPYSEVITGINKDSDNLSAEMTLRALGSLSSDISSAEKGLAYIDTLLLAAGFDPEAYEFADGSGVSRYTLVSAELLAGVLAHIFNEHPEKYITLKESLPVAGIDGTLKYRMRGSDAEGKVFAKTGTLSGVSSLSGYIETNHGSQIVFSIIMQNFTGSAREARELQNRLCEMLVEYKGKP